VIYRPRPTVAPKGEESGATNSSADKVEVTNGSEVWRDTDAPAESPLFSFTFFSASEIEMGLACEPSPATFPSTTTSARKETGKREIKADESAAAFSPGD